MRGSIGAESIVHQFCLVVSRRLNVNKRVNVLWRQEHVDKNKQ